MKEGKKKGKKERGMKEGKGKEKGRKKKKSRDNCVGQNFVVITCKKLPLGSILALSRIRRTCFIQTRQGYPL